MWTKTRILFNKQISTLIDELHFMCRLLYKDIHWTVLSLILFRITFTIVCTCIAASCQFLINDYYYLTKMFSSPGVEKREGLFRLCLFLRVHDAFFYFVESDTLIHKIVCLIDWLSLQHNSGHVGFLWNIEDRVHRVNICMRLNL